MRVLVRAEPRSHVTFGHLSPGAGGGEPAPSCEGRGEGHGEGRG